jgi:hypothetical protein
MLRAFIAEVNTSTGPGPTSMAGSSEENFNPVLTALDHGPQDVD